MQTKDCLLLLTNQPLGFSIMTFATKRDLVKWLTDNDYAQLSSGEWYAAGTYNLAHGEYSQPDYAVRRYKDGWSLHGNYYYYFGTWNAKQNGRVSEEFFLSTEF